MQQALKFPIVEVTPSVWDEMIELAEMCFLVAPIRLAEHHYEAAENCTGPYLYQAKKSEYGKARRAYKKACKIRDSREDAHNEKRNKS